MTKLLLGATAAFKYTQKTRRVLPVYSLRIPFFHRNTTILAECPLGHGHHTIMTPDNKEDESGIREEAATTPLDLLNALGSQACPACPFIQKKKKNGVGVG